MDIAQLSMNMADVKLAQGFQIGMLKMAMEQTETLEALMTETMQTADITAMPAIPEGAAATIDFRI